MPESVGHWRPPLGGQPQSLPMTDSLVGKKDKLTGNGCGIGGLVGCAGAIMKCGDRRH